VDDVVTSLPSPEFWAKKRVFVTGHTGFKGSWLCSWLETLGAETTGFALPPAADRSLFEDAHVERGMRSLTGDVRDATAVLRAVAAASPDIVLHLAAQPLVRRSYLEPVETLASNVLGTAHVLEAARRVASVRVVVIVTTDKCYENREWCWGYRETDALGGRDPYSASKAAAELVTAAYRDSFLAGRVAVASVRAGNVIGGGDWSEDRLVPDVVRSVERGLPVKIRNPRSVRPWQHVLDPLAGYLVLAERLWHTPALQGAYNFGPRGSDSATVYEIATALVRALGRGRLELPGSATNEPHEAATLRLDCSKAETVLGFSPRLGTERTVELTASWYANYLEDRRSAPALVSEQLLAYGRS
jgi:CDP-glucose 4,6-dehydratase